MFAGSHMCHFPHQTSLQDFPGCFSFHEIGVTALFHSNIDLHTPDLFPAVRATGVAIPTLRELQS
jgi:hypothetical protein